MPHLKRQCLIVLLALVTGCSDLSDAQTAWCDANRGAVTVAANSLDIPTPINLELFEAIDLQKVNPDGYVRACKAAFDAEHG